MGALVGVLGRRDDNTVPLVITMLQELAHRGGQSHVLVTPTEIVSAQSIAELVQRRSVLSAVSIGRNFSSRGRPDPLNTHGGKIVLEGRVFRKSVAPRLCQTAIDDGYPPEKIGERIIQDFDGSYAFALASDGQMLVGRDPLGTMPLYYGEDESFCAVASERKALWKIGIYNARPFPPGNLARVNHDGFSFEPVWTVRPRPRRGIKASVAASRLRKLLEESIRRRLHGANKVGIAFSGGLDSSIVARIVREGGVSAQLISVSLEGQPEPLHAERAARALQLSIMIKKYEVSEVEDTLARVLWLIEEPDVMKVGVAIPLFWSAQIASSLGCDVIFAGQGADELFGGYHRYLTLYRERGPEEVAEMLVHDTLRSYDTNFQRDEPLCAYHKIELSLPFADTSVVRYALNLPISMKIQSTDDVLRKRILRHMAKSLRIPAFIAERPKRAIQYETGVDKALRNLARTKGLTLHEYIKQVFNSVYPTSEGR